MAVLDEHLQGFGIMSPDVPAISLDRPGLWKYSPVLFRKKAMFFSIFTTTSGAPILHRIGFIFPA